MKILLTGANGFVGRHFNEYNRNRYTIWPLSLRNGDWKKQSFAGVDVVVHLAGKAHEMQAIDEQVYYDINTELTKQVYEKAVADGVRHFIYISSTKVYGDAAEGVLTENSPANPTDAYGKSKLQAEQFLLNHDASECTVAIVRPSLVYGAEVKGNMWNLLKLCARRIPLPFKNIRNRRSMVAVQNLVALINTIIDKRAGGIFLAADAEPLSTETLVTCIRAGMNRKPKLVSIPGFLRGLIKKLKPALYIRLFGSYEVNPAAGYARIGFVPPVSSEQGIAEMVRWFLEQKDK